MHGIMMQQAAYASKYRLNTWHAVLLEVGWNSGVYVERWRVDGRLQQPDNAMCQRSL